MKKICTLLSLFISVLAFAQSGTGLVVSQVYTTTGNSPTTYKAGYVELFNRTTSPVNLATGSIQYTAATATSDWTVVALPALTIPAGGYYLIQIGADGASGAALPTPDYKALSASSLPQSTGKVALVNGVTALTACPSASAYIDLVGYGIATPLVLINCYEGAGPAAYMSNEKANIRKGKGCTDTNNNGADFELTTPAPRNSATPVRVCGAAYLSATALPAFGNVCINTTTDAQSFTITGDDLGTSSVTVAALAGFTYATTATGTYNTTLSLTPTAGALSQQVYVKFNPAAVQSYNGNIVISVTISSNTTSINVNATGAGVNSMASVNTGAASMITQTTATAAGSITGNGCSPVTEYGIQYSTSSPVTASSSKVASNNLSGGGFSSGLSGLSAGTVYYYRAYATNSGGTAYGAEMSFTTLPPGPAITTTTLADFGNVCINTTATKSFTINGTNLTTENLTVTALPGYTYSTVSAGPYTTSLTLTQGGGTYTKEIFVKFSPVAVQSYNGDILVKGGGASDAKAVAKGAGVNTPTTVTTGDASAITINSATAAGTVAAGCATVTGYGIKYSTTTGFGSGPGTAVASNNLSNGSYSSGLTSLTQGTTYYYRAYAVNGNDTIYGPEKSFTTATPVLTVTPLTAFGDVCVNTTTAAKSFTINGTNLTSASIVVGPLAGYTFSDMTGGSYTATLTLTQPGGTYAKEVFVKFAPTITQSYNGNIAVSGGGAATVNATASGKGVTSTLVVTTGMASGITNNSAVLAGSSAGSGCSATTEVGFEYSTMNNFTPGSGTKVTATAGNSFTATVNGLAQGATYYYRAYVKNADGTIYGEQQTFTTVAIPDEFVAYPVPARRGQAFRFSMNNLEPGYYGLLFYNSAGALVYRKDMNIQATLINETITIPETLTTGTYRVQLFNSKKAIAAKTIVISQ